MLRRGLFAIIAFAAACAWAGPDEDKLGKDKGYPVGTARTYFYDESVRVGSFTAQGEIPGIFGGKANVLAPSEHPMPLPRAEHEPDYRWEMNGRSNLKVDDYLARQRIMGLMIVKDGVIQVERYQYERTGDMRFLSNSMAKSITSLAVGIALAEGAIASLDDRADKYAPKLAGTLYGETTIRNLLHMASGARFVENYDRNDDLERFNVAANQDGIEAAAAVITERAAPQGTVFHYASPQTDILAVVVRAATGKSLADYLTTRLWQPIGAATSALWRADRFGAERAAGSFNATLADYARLGIVLANDGVRPDDPAKKQIVPRDYLLDATDWRRQPEPFRPHVAQPYYGYGFLFWLFPTNQRRFAFLGVYGQLIFIDPALKLVIVQTAANATAKIGQTTMGKEQDAFIRGVVRHYTDW